MSSSPTETLRRRDDAADGRVGRRGHGRRVARAVGDWVDGRGDDLRDLDRQDRHRGAVARRRRVAEIARRGRARPSRSATVLARIATGASRRAARPSGVRGRRAGARRRRRAAAARTRAASAGGAAALLAGRAAHRRRARHRPRRGGGHRPRRARAQAGRAGARRWTATAPSARRAAAAHREPVPARSAGAAPPAAGAAAADGGGAVAHAPPDRRAHEALARHRGDVHDLDRGRHEPGRGGARAAGRHRAAVRRPGDDRRAARAPGAQRVARGRALHARTTTSTSASPSRSARTA